MKLGVGRIDITFNKSVPMAGYSLVGSVATGVWTELSATCYNIESGDKNLFLLNVDLVGVSRLLVQSIVDRCRSHGFVQITRENLVVSATHTHTAPSGFFDSGFYNTFIGTKSGFIKDVFDFLVDRLSTVVINSIKAEKKECILTHMSGNLNQIQINRSFNKDPFTEVDVFMFKDKSDPNQITGSMVYLSVHPTVTGKDFNMFSSDLFGYARDLLEKRYNTKFSFFNVAVGDNAPYVHNEFYQSAQPGRDGRLIELIDGCSRDIPGCVKLGTRLYEQLATLIDAKVEDIVDIEINSNGGLLQPLFNIESLFCDISKQKFVDIDGRFLLTETNGSMGLSTVGGSEEGANSVGRFFGWREINGDKTFMRRWKDVPDKKPHIFNVFARPSLQGVSTALFNTVRKINNAFSGYDIGDFPSQFRVFHYNFGRYHFYTAPFELTSGAVETIRDDLHRSKYLNQNIKIIPVSVTDTYLSYLCNEQDYNLQTYEGSSTLYGRNSCKFLINRFLNMNDQKVEPIMNYNMNRQNEGASLIGDEIIIHKKR